MGKVRVAEFAVSTVAVGYKSMLAAWQASPVPTRPGHPEEAVEIVVGPTGSSLASEGGACELGNFRIFCVLLAVFFTGRGWFFFLVRRHGPPKCA